MHRRKDELVVKACLVSDIYQSSYVFILEGTMELDPGSLISLYMRIDGLERPLAIVEIVEKNSAGQYQVKPIWLQFHRQKLFSTDQYRSPLVTAKPYVSRQALDNYIKQEGIPGFTYSAETDIAMYIARRQTRVWTVYELDKQIKQYELLFSANSLSEVKQRLCQERPEVRNQVQQWGLRGAQIVNPLDYGAAGDGRVDDYDILSMIVRTMKVGDLLFLPPGRQFRVRDEIFIPAGVKVDAEPHAILLKPLGDHNG